MAKFNIVKLQTGGSVTVSKGIGYTPTQKQYLPLEAFKPLPKDPEYKLPELELPKPEGYLSGAFSKHVGDVYNAANNWIAGFDNIDKKINQKKVAQIAAKITDPTLHLQLKNQGLQFEEAKKRALDNKSMYAPAVIDGNMTFVMDKNGAYKFVPLEEMARNRSDYRQLNWADYSAYFEAVGSRDLNDKSYTQIGWNYGEEKIKSTIEDTLKSAGSEKIASINKEIDYMKSHIPQLNGMLAYLTKGDLNVGSPNVKEYSSNLKQLKTMFESLWSLNPTFSNSVKAIAASKLDLSGKTDKEARDLIDEYAQSLVLNWMTGGLVESKTMEHKVDLLDESSTSLDPRGKGENKETWDLFSIAATLNENTVGDSYADLVKAKFGSFDTYGLVLPTAYVETALKGLVDYKIKGKGENGKSTFTTLSNLAKDTGNRTKFITAGLEILNVNNNTEGLPILPEPGKTIYYLPEDPETVRKFLEELKEDKLEIDARMVGKSEQEKEVAKKAAEAKLAKDYRDRGVKMLPHMVATVMSTVENQGKSKLIHGLDGAITSSEYASDKDLANAAWIYEDDLLTEGAIKGYYKVAPKNKAYNASEILGWDDGDALMGLQIFVPIYNMEWNNPERTKKDVDFKRDAKARIQNEAANAENLRVQQQGATRDNSW